MKFEYNGNLLEEDRIKLVAHEIVNKYPQISYDKAEEAAILEGRISSPVTISDQLNRLYIIMLANKNNKNIVFTVFKDYLYILNCNLDNEDINIYINIIDKINNFLNNKSDFPFIEV